MFPCDQDCGFGQECVCPDDCDCPCSYCVCWLAEVVSKRKAHNTTLAKRNLFGARMWWATCTCGWVQGCHHKQDAQRLEREHNPTEDDVRI